MGRADLLELGARREIADTRIGLDVLAGIVVERLAGLLVDALGPVDLRIGLRQDRLTVEAVEGVEEAVAGRVGDELGRLPCDVALPGSRGAGMVNLRHTSLPVAASRPAIQSRTPWSPLAAPTMSLSLMASGAAVKVTSGVSENEVSHTTLPLSLSVAMMRGELPKPPAPVMTRLPHNAAPGLRIWRSCLGSMRHTMRPTSPERTSIL